jgi:trans-2,3-dihydro-3-hydroxyanthranilate isomerase
MQLPYLIADVFTDQPFAGNPLAVYPHATGLDDRAMQRIATEMNLSETIFVFPPENPANAARVRIFTPARELPFAGHPTVGCAIVLAALGLVPTPEGDSHIVLEEGVGPVGVKLTIRDGSAVFAELAAAVAPSFNAAVDNAAIAAMLGLPESDIVAGAEVASCGNPFLCVPLASREALARCVPNATAMGRLAECGARGIYVYWQTTPERLHARMFGFGIGMIEDPATGSAAVALGGLLAARAPGHSGSYAWEIMQGEDLGRPSRLLLSADKADGRVTAVRVGGAAVIVAEGVLSY